MFSLLYGWNKVFGMLGLVEFTNYILVIEFTNYILVNSTTLTNLYKSYVILNLILIWGNYRIELTALYLLIFFSINN